MDLVLSVLGTIFLMLDFFNKLLNSTADEKLDLTLAIDIIAIIIIWLLFSGGWWL